MARDAQEFQNCPDCFIYWSAPAAMFDARRKDGKSFFCPNGHSLSYRDNENDRVRRERDQLKQQAARLQQETTEAWAEAEREHRRAAAARGQVTRLKNRAAVGVCPCCNRSFDNLKRHMASKHAGFVAEEVESDTGQAVH